MANKESGTKQAIINEISSLLGIGPFKVGHGSSEPAEFFRALAEALRIDLRFATTKPEIGRRIVESAGLEWDSDCDSTGSTSGGGSTVTTKGLERMKDAAIRLTSGAPESSPQALDIRPGIESLLTYRHHGYETWYAIAELVDNSVASYRISKRNNPFSDLGRLRVEVAFDKDSRTIVVSDTAGGIEINRLQDALIAGRAPTDKSDLNQFGMGLKTASFWFGSDLSIETYPVGKGVRIDVDVDLYALVRSKGVVTPSVTPVRGDNHGTRITIRNLWPERAIPTAKTLGMVRDYLSSIYRRDIEMGDLTLVVAGKELSAPSREVLEAPRWDELDGDSKRWEKDVEIQVDDRKIKGRVWLLSRGDTANAGLVLTWKDKAIVGAGAGANDANDSYRPVLIYGRSNSFVSQRLMGELDMSAFSVTAKKDGLEWTEDEQERFAELLKTAIDAEPFPLIKMATMYRKRTKIVDTTADIRSALSSVKTALEQFQPDVSDQLSFEKVPMGDQGAPWETSAKAAGDEDGAFEHLDIELPPFLPGLRTGVLRVIYEPMVREVVRWRKDSKDTLIIEVNRASHFLENYSALPQFHLEPTLRLFAALVVAQIKVEAGGSRAGRQMLEAVNELLNQSLGMPYLEASLDE